LAIDDHIKNVRLGNTMQKMILAYKQTS